MMPRLTQHSQNGDLSQSQVMTQSSLSQVPTSEKKVHDLVKYFLKADQAKTVIKKSDISKYVLKEHAKYFKQFIGRAREVLQQIYGYNIIETDSKSFILVNLLDTARPVRDENELPSSLNEISEDHDQKSGLLMIILSLLFMNNGVQEDESFYHDLAKFNVDVGRDEKHETFGDVKKLLKLLIKQGYLEHNRKPNTDPAIYEYRWGFRAHAEVKKADVLKFVCKLLGNVSPENFPTQLLAVKEEEAQNSNAGDSS